jgi:tetratricopeptide (TPR) repeat protein
MNSLFANSRSPLAFLLMITGLTICLFAGHQSVYAQKTSKEVAHQKPALTLENILRALQAQISTPTERNKLTLAAVKERGVTFIMSPGIEQQLTEAGASKTLLAVISKEAEKFRQTSFYYRNLGDDFRRDGNGIEAINNYTKAIEIDPNDRAAYNNRGVVYDNLKRYDEAIADFTRALEIGPTDKIAYINRGISYYNKTEYQKAIADYDKAIEIDSTLALAYDNRANAHQMMGRLDLAAADRQKSKELKP